MRALVIMQFPARARALALALEDLGEEWRAAWCCDGAAAWRRLAEGDVDLLALDGWAQAPGGRQLLTALTEHPPLPPPWTVAVEPSGGAADGVLDACGSVGEWAADIRRVVETQTLPRLCAPLLPPLTALAQELLAELGLKRDLRAAGFLPEMLAWCAAHPQLLQGVTGRLYPCFAARYGLRAGAVERDLRSALESLWSSGSLPAIEKWFGHTVDPEKGRPTNREFLALGAEHIRRLGQRTLEQPAP